MRPVFFPRPYQTKERQKRKKPLERTQQSIQLILLLSTPPQSCRFPEQTCHPWMETDLGRIVMWMKTMPGNCMSDKQVSRASERGPLSAIHPPAFFFFFLLLDRVYLVLSLTVGRVLSRGCVVHEDGKPLPVDQEHQGHPLHMR